MTVTSSVSTIALRTFPIFQGLGDAGDEHGVQVGTGSVDGGAVAGGAGAKDEQLDVTSGHRGGSL